MSGAAQARQRPGALGSVLVVDDDDGTRAALADLLREEGYEVAEARDGAEALESLRRGPRPDVVLLDLMMPGMDGWEFRERQLADPALADLAVVVVTAAADAAPASVARQDVFRKPLDFVGLLERLDDLMGDGAPGPPGR